MPIARLQLLLQFITPGQLALFRLCPCIEAMHTGAASQYTYIAHGNGESPSVAV